MAEQTARIESDVVGVGESRTFGEGFGYGSATAAFSAGDGGKMVAVASQLRVRAVRLAEKAKRRAHRNPRATVSVLIDIGFYLVYALLVVRLLLGLFAGSADDPFRSVGPSGAALVWTVVLALAAFMILHGIVNRMRLARRYHQHPMPRLWIGRLL